MEINFPKIKNPFGDRKAKKARKRLETCSRQADEKFWVQALGDELMICYDDAPVVPFSLLRDDVRAKYSEILGVCKKAYIDYKMRGYGDTDVNP